MTASHTHACFIILNQSLYFVSSQAAVNILNHPKIGFGMLLTPFLRETLPIWFKIDIIEKKSPIQRLISKSYLSSLLKKHINKKNQGFKLWILYALNKWLEVNNFA